MSPSQLDAIAVTQPRNAENSLMFRGEWTCSEWTGIILKIIIIILIIIVIITILIILIVMTRIAVGSKHIDAIGRQGKIGPQISGFSPLRRVLSAGSDLIGFARRRLRAGYNRPRRCTERLALSVPTR